MKIFYLYLKEVPSGLKYLGITTQNPYKYYGSGVFWRRHLKKYKYGIKEIKTEILFKSENQKEVEIKGLHYSNLWNVIKNPEFANLISESGYGGKLIGLSNDAKQNNILYHSKKIKQYDLEGNFVREFDSIKEAALITNSNKSQISNCCRNLAFSANRFRYSFSNQELILDINEKNKTNKRKVFQYTKNMLFIKEWNCVADAARFYNTPDTNIFSVIHGKSKSAIGFIWKYPKLE